MERLLDVRRSSAALSLEAQQRATAKYVDRVLEARKSSAAISLDALQSATVKCMERRLTVHLDPGQANDLLTEKVRQLAFVVQRLLEEFDLFKNMESSVLENVSKIVHYTSMRAGQLVFKQGDLPNFCYVILSGEVTVWMSKSFRARCAMRRAVGELKKMDQTARSKVSKIEAEEQETEKPTKNARPHLVPTSMLAREVLLSSNYAWQLC